MGCLLEMLLMEIAGSCLQALLLFIWRLILFVFYLIVWPFEYVFRLVTKDDPPSPPWDVFFPDS